MIDQTYDKTSAAGKFLIDGLQPFKHDVIGRTKLKQGTGSSIHIVPQQRYVNGRWYRRTPKGWEPQ